MRHSIPMVAILRLAFSMVVLLGYANGASAQEASLQGIVTAAQSGQTLSGATVVLEADGVQPRSVGTDRNGLYLIGGIASGAYTLRVRFIGYTEYSRELFFEPGSSLTVNVQLATVPIVLEGIDVAAPDVSVVIRELGRQTVTPSELRRIPTPAASGDLATYLQTLPGVVTTGDRGGQLFVRGGTHAENLTLLDGLVIYQPFHIVGAFSAFPEDLVASADFYAGGFGARYSGRTSSVLDVQMRDGDRTDYRAAGSFGPVVAEATVEGPLGTRPISWVYSARKSLLDRTADALLSEPVPLTFDSHFLKVTSFTDDPHSRCSITALRTADQGRLDAEDEVSWVGWKNLALGGRCVALVEEGFLRFVEVSTGYSSVTNEAITRGAAELEADVSRLHLDVNLSSLIGARRVDFGSFLRLEKMTYDLVELYGGTHGKEDLWSTGGYLEFEVVDGERLTLVPGAVVSIQPILSFEPRLRLSWRPRGERTAELSGALGIYRQALVGISDVRDASSVFIAWKHYGGEAPMESRHAQLGWQQTVGNVNWSVEGYLREMTNISVPLWEVSAAFNTRLGVANGSVRGVDTRIEYMGGRFYGFVGYGYSRALYRSAQQNFGVWFGEPIQSYNPPHDRRHQVNAIGSVEVGEFSVGVRWQLGTGLPFTRPMGFDEFFDYRADVQSPYHFFGETRMIVDKPYLGRLPTMHRLDLSVQRDFDFSFGRLEVRGGAMNLYDRRNIFYYDVYTQRRVDQLPLFPYLSVRFGGN